MSAGPLQVVVTGCTEDARMVSTPRPGEDLETDLVSIGRKVEVTVRALCRSDADYERWRAQLGKTLTVQED